MSVWQLSKEMQRLDDLIESEAMNSGGEVSHGLLQAFDRLAEMFDPESTSMLLRKLRSESEMFDAQAKRFKEVALHRANAMKSLKAAVIVVLDAKGVRKEGDLTVCKNGGKLPLEWSGKATEEFIKYEPSVDMEKVRSALDAGENLEFAEYGERGRHLRVKG